VDRLLQEGVWNAVVMFRELQTKGYTGQLSILRDYIRPKRALRASRATVRFETKPGQQLQSDGAVTRTEIAGRQTDVSFIVSSWRTHWKPNGEVASNAALKVASDWPGSHGSKRSTNSTSSFSPRSIARWCGTWRP
jgi:hypothetical protein